RRQPSSQYSLIEDPPTWAMLSQGTVNGVNRIRGWRRHPRLFGKPDFVFPRQKIVLFVDGCFWHGCPRPKHAPLPKNRADWWAKKLAQNKLRDRIVTRTLQSQGWRVIRVW